MSDGRQDAIGAALRGAFSQPHGQSLPAPFLALLVELDRSKRPPAPKRG